jgi:hypothetical protein
LLAVWGEFKREIGGSIKSINMAEIAKSRKVGNNPVFFRSKNDHLLNLIRVYFETFFKERACAHILHVLVQ